MAIVKIPGEVALKLTSTTHWTALRAAKTDRQIAEDVQNDPEAASTTVEQWKKGTRFHLHAKKLADK